MPRVQFLVLFVLFLVQVTQAVPLFDVSNEEPMPWSEEEVGDSVPVFGTENVQFRKCGTSSDLLDLKSIFITPNPPVVGQPLVIELLGSLSGQVDEGSLVSVTAKLGIITVVQDTLDLCALAREYGRNCPIPVGDQALSIAVPIPQSIPKRVTFNIKAVAKTAQGAAITCLGGTVRVA